MPIYQTNLFICEVCGETESVTREEDPYSDPVINLPDGWGYADPLSREDEPLCCFECLLKVTSPKRRKNED